MGRYDGPDHYEDYSGPYDFTLLYVFLVFCVLNGLYHWWKDRHIRRHEKENEATSLIRPFMHKGKNKRKN